MIYGDCWGLAVQKQSETGQNYSRRRFLAISAAVTIGTGGPIKGRSAVYGVSGELGGSPVPSKDYKTRI